MAALGLNSVFCILCGAPVTHVGQDFPLWMYSFRAIYTKDDAYGSACVSGEGARYYVAQALQTNDRAPLSWPQDDTLLNGGHLNAIRRKVDLNRVPEGTPEMRELFWGFPLHCACWDLLITLRPRELLDVQTIFDICRSLPLVDKLLLFGHDYGGICKPDLEPDALLGAYPGENPQTMCHKEDPLSHGLIMDETTEHPLDIYGLRLIFEAGCTDDGDHCFTNYLTDERGTQNDPFAALPFEILIPIAIELKSKDILQLKQASRIYANLVLSDDFWHSRFQRGGEFEHVFESKEYGSICQGRWRSVFFKAKDLQKLPEMRNRKRTVTLAQGLLDLVDRRGQISCSMLDYPPPLLGLLESTACLDPQKWVTASRNLLPPNERFDHGTRCLYKLTIRVPSDITSVFVSTIDVFGLLYISGLRFEKNNGESRYVGYIHLDSEALVTWDDPRSVRVTGFQLAQDQRGIRGIAVESAAGGLSNWLGEYDGIPRRRLVPHGSERDGSHGVVLLQGGFDGLKLVTLSVASKYKSEADSQSSNNDESPDLRDTNIWFPEVPDPSLSFTGVPELRRTYKQRGDEMPLSMILFGGLKGELLPHIVKMTFWAANHRPPAFLVWGIEFTFDRLVEGKSSLVLGRSDGGRRYDCPIDGRGGERICQMELTSQYGYTCPYKFKIHTTRNRTFKFPPTDGRIHLRGDPIMQSLSANNGTIIGFFSRMSSQITPHGAGLVYIKDPADAQNVKLESHGWRATVGNWVLAAA
ncbi:hypothetical protein V494_02310 [Pseudogymnoascus sp. VKM F-4513 (FW-928)]|nr:hypothetical protein V494_02310 [Pseudogymnoascus sp. VKM F-4513 (FW-928)]